MRVTVRSRWFSRSCAGLCWLTLCLAQPAGAGAEIIERLLATVSGQLVMASDVAAARVLGLASPEETDRQVLDRLIDRALILAEVERYAPPEPSDVAIDRDIDRLRAGFADAEAFERGLATLGLDERIVRERLRQNHRIDAYLDLRFAVALPADAEIEKAFLENPARFTRGGAATVEEARAEVMRLLIGQRRAPRVAEWVEGLRSRSRITLLLEDTAPTPLSE